MIRVDTRSAKVRRFYRYAKLTFKTIVFFSGFIAAYLLVKHGF